MNSASAIDLSKLSLPDLSNADRDILDAKESEVGLLRAFNQTNEDRKTVLKMAVNNAARSVMLATGKGDELDHIAALFGIKRLVVKAADTEATPPKPAIMESDERLRLRSRLSLYALSQAGCEGAYLFRALSASPFIKDISVYSDNINPEKINVIVLSDQSGGAEDSDRDSILNKVELSLAEVRSITDEIVVRWAKAIEFSIRAELEVEDGVDTGKLAKNVKKDISNLVKTNHRLGKNILRSEFFAVLYKPGVESVRLLQPKTDIAIGIDSAAHNPLIEDLEDDYSISILPAADP